MSSARFQLLEAVLGELGPAQARSSSHSTPPVAPPVAPLSALKSHAIATLATVATRNGQVCRTESENPGVPLLDHEDDNGKEAPVQYLSNNVASVATVATPIENKALFCSHMDEGCGYCGYSPETGGNPYGVAVCDRSPSIAGGVPDHARMPSVPEAWLTGLALMSRMAAPAGVTPADWDGFVAGATRLLVAWGAQLAALGWTTPDLFAVHRFRPMNRNDYAGLVRFLGQDDVRAVTATTVTLRTRSGAIQTFYRRTPSDSDWMLMWELGDRSRRA